MQAGDVLVNLHKLLEALQPVHDSIALAHADSPEIARVPNLAFEAAAHLVPALQQVQRTEDISAHMLEQHVRPWAACLRELGMYKVPEHGLQCIRYSAVKGYEHILEVHAVDVVRQHGAFAKFGARRLEVGHKYSKGAINRNSSHGGGEGAEAGTSFRNMPKQVLRRCSTANACGRIHQIDAINAHYAQASGCWHDPDDSERSWCSGSASMESTCSSVELVSEQPLQSEESGSL